MARQYNFALSGAKRTSNGWPNWLDLSKMTQSGHEGLGIAAMQTDPWMPFRRPQIPDLISQCQRAPEPLEL
jgi:hypothetical protein